MSFLLRRFKLHIKYFLFPMYAKQPSSRKKTLKIFNLLPYFPFALLKSLWKIASGYLEIFHIDFVVTTKCSLHCKNCANLMQYYTKPYDIDVTDLINNFDKLMNTIDYLHELRILGGEPFIHRQLDTLIIHIRDHPKVGGIKFITNGTVLPNEDLLKVLKHPKIKISISDYGVISGKKEQLERVLLNNNIEYNVNSIRYWRDYGNMKKRNRNLKQLKSMFSGCQAMCNSYLNGEYHLCPRSAHGMDLGLIPRIPPPPANYVDIYKLDKKEARKQLKRLLYKTKHVIACDYCNNSRYIPLKKVTPGEQ